MNGEDINKLPLVILSGPTRGLGRELFEQLIFQAFPVVGVGRDLGRIATVANSATTPVKLVEVDFGADSDVLADALDLLRLILNDTITGPLVFISNSSIIEPIGQATGLSLSALERTMRINCLTPLMFANVLTQTALAQGRSLLILNVSSGAACRPVRGWQAYCTSKSAYKMGLDVLAEENSHVQVVHFDPGVMDTAMQELIRAQHMVDMPGVEVFRSFREKGLLNAPPTVATELLQLMKCRLS
jgi:benzil reductase ((S)-benzoin forming)